MPTLSPRQKQRWWVAVQKCCFLTAPLGWKWFKMRVKAGNRLRRNSAPPKVADKVWTNRRKAEGLLANQIRTHSRGLDLNGRSLLGLLYDWSKTHRAFPCLATRLSRQFVSRAAWSVLTRPSVHPIWACLHYIAFLFVDKVYIYNFKTWLLHPKYLYFTFLENCISWDPILSK